MECLWECGELPVTRGEMSEPRAQLCGMGGCRLTGSVVLDVQLGLLRGQHGAQQGCRCCTLATRVMDPPTARRKLSQSPLALPPPLPCWS